MVATSYSRHSLLASLAFFALAAVACAEPPGINTRLEQLEHEVTQLREENRRQRIELELLSHSLAMAPEERIQTVSGALPVSCLEPSAAQEDPDVEADELLRLAEEIDDLRFTIQRLGCRLDHCGDNLSVSLLDKEWTATITGAMIGEMIFAEQRPVIPSAIVLVSPSFGRDTPTFDVHGKSSKIGVLFRGPDFGGLQMGGAMLAYFFGEEFLADIAGINLIGGYAELRNEHWRFLFGRAGDLINPRRPGTLDFNSGRNAGNVGFTRGQFRVEHFLHPNRNTQVTTQLSLSNPIATAYDGSLTNLVEDNGWPNLEGRLVLGAGPVAKRFGVETRRFEIGMSGLLGQLRRTDFDNPTLLDVWAFGVEGKADLTEYFGVRGEFFHGQALGNLNGGILQIVNPITLEEVRTTGGWGDIHINWTECLQSSLGFGIDNPSNRTVAPAFPNRNAFIFGNLVWNASNSLEVGFEVAHWDTDYAPAPDLGDKSPRDNEAMIYRTRIVFRF